MVCLEMCSLERRENDMSERGIKKGPKITKKRKNVAFTFRKRILCCGTVRSAEKLVSAEN